MSATGKLPVFTVLIQTQLEFQLLAITGLSGRLVPLMTVKHTRFSKLRKTNGHLALVDIIVFAIIEKQISFIY